MLTILRKIQEVMNLNQSGNCGIIRGVAGKGGGGGIPGVLEPRLTPLSCVSSFKATLLRYLSLIKQLLVIWNPLPPFSLKNTGKQPFVIWNPLPPHLPLLKNIGYAPVYYNQYNCNKLCLWGVTDNRGNAAARP